MDLSHTANRSLLLVEPEVKRLAAAVPPEIFVQGYNAIVPRGLNIVGHCDWGLRFGRGRGGIHDGEDARMTAAGSFILTKDDLDIPKGLGLEWRDVR